MTTTTTDGVTGDDWAAQRREAARIQGERLAARKDAEHDAAEALIAQWLPVARGRGPAPVPLRVQGYGGKGSAKTALRGWYLRLDETIAVADDGRFYVLTAPISLADRLRGASPAPSRPPLLIGAGGKDGDSIDLADALDRIVTGWR